MCKCKRNTHNFKLIIKEQPFKIPTIPKVRKLGQNTSQLTILKATKHGGQKQRQKKSFKKRRVKKQCMCLSRFEAKNITG